MRAPVIYSNGPVLAEAVRASFYGLRFSILLASSIRYMACSLAWNAFARMEGLAYGDGLRGTGRWIRWLSVSAAAQSGVDSDEDVGIGPLCTIVLCLYCCK